ncbi:hypothetical protein [Winogradskyella sediminis]|uniref:hypothetical protein n=1 Tax=Winogradskyella sediminis TaxID=1382466 RepID=UPI000E22483B|nr:hypothetical protein [Winogradskyella sediminis]REG87272.1 hypothetical protein C8N41_102107 [Winogradskyella sediminis]
MADGSLSQFKATLARKIERNQKRQARSDRYSTSYKNSDSKTEFDFPKLSESELEKVKSDIQKKAKSERKKELIVIVIVFAIVTLIILYLI